MEFKSQELDKYIHTLLLKPDTEELTNNDIEQVKDIILNKYTITGKEIEYDYSDLKKLINVEKCSIELVDITNDLISNLNMLNNLKILEIGHSPIKSTIRLKNDLTNIILSFVDEDVLNLFEECLETESVELISFTSIDIQKLISFKKLKRLCIYNSNIINSHLLKEFGNLQHLKLDGSKLDDENVLNTLNKNIKVEKKDKFFFANA